MSVLVVLVTSDGVRHAGNPICSGSPDHDFVSVPGFSQCPACGENLADDDSKLFVRGTGITGHDNNTYYADAIALCCKKPVGQLRATVDTIFGIEEDEAVLEHSRCRVYWPDGTKTEGKI